MDRLSLERRQVWIYLAAIVGGLILGSLQPAVAAGFEALLWPVLATLLYATFVQVPLLHVRHAFRDRSFVVAILLGNFVLIPLLVWLVLQCLPNNPVLHLGVTAVNDGETPVLVFEQRGSDRDIVHDDYYHLLLEEAK